MVASAWNWTKWYSKVMNDFEPGQTENPENHSMLFSGLPGTSKNYTCDWFKEAQIDTGVAKCVEINAQKPTHLNELLSYAIPNGYVENKRSLEEVQKVVDGIEEGKYDQHDLSLEQVEEFFDCENSVEKRDKLKDLIALETNGAILNRLRSAKGLQEEIINKMSLIINNVLQNNSMPDELQDRYRDGNGLLRGYNIEIFVPISTQMPDKEVPDFFNPFGVPVDAFSRYKNVEWALDVVFNGKADQGYSDLYYKIVEPGNTSFTDLKIEEPDDDREYVTETRFGQEDDDPVELTDPGDESQKLGNFQSEWSKFNKQGVLCSSDFKYTLRDQLEEKLLDPNTEFLFLYTGYINDPDVRIFVITYFVEILRDIIDSWDSETVRKHFDFRILLGMLEAQELLKKTGRGGSGNKSHKVFADMFKEYANQFRHNGIDFIADSKPDDAHPIMRSKAGHRIVTRMNIEDFLDTFTGMKKDFRDNTQDAFADPDYRDIGKLGRGFVRIDEQKVVEWTKKSGEYSGKTTYGFRLPCPKRSSDKIINESDDDFEVFLDDLGYREAGRTMNLNDYQELLKADWRNSESEVIEKLDEIREKEKQSRQQMEDEKLEAQMNSARTMARNYLIENGLPENSGHSWNDVYRFVIDELNLDKNPKTVEIWLKKENPDGEGTYRDQIIEKVKEKTESFDKSEVVDVVIGNNEEMSEYAIDFIFYSYSTEDKKDVVDEYLREERDMDLGINHDIVESITSKARRKLRRDRIINRQNQVQVEGETEEDQIRNFKQVKGIPIEDTSEEFDQVIREVAESVRFVFNLKSNERKKNYVIRHLQQKEDWSKGYSSDVIQKITEGAKELLRDKNIIADNNRVILDGRNQEEQILNFKEEMDIPIETEADKVDLDVAVTELKNDPVYVFENTSSMTKSGYVDEYLKDNHDIQGEYDLTNKIVERSVEELQEENVIDDSMNPKIDREEWESQHSGVEEDESEPDYPEWECGCGALNEEGRESCRACGTDYENRDEDFEENEFTPSF